MQNFFIKQGATQPILLMKINSDSRFMYEDFQKALENSALTFSMVNIENGQLKVAKKIAGIIPYMEDDKVIGENGYYIYYKFTSKDTNTPGSYRGEFKVEFFNYTSNEYSGTFIAPIHDELIITVIESLF